VELFERELATMKKALLAEDYTSLHEEMENANKLQEIFS
jgi:hypothetical protein